MKKQIDKKRRMDDAKLLWHLEKVDDYYKKGKRIAPIHIDAGIAKFCNIRCVFCYGLYQNTQPTFIQEKPLLDFITDAADIGVKSIAFIGDGEPTCNPHLYQALKLGHSLNLDMSISTNGLLVNTEEKALQILQTCQWMRFCISAGTKEGYITIHQRDYFKQVVNNIKLMVDTKNKYNLPCEIGMQAVFVPTIMLNEMYEESKLAISLGVDYFVIKQCSLPSNSSNSGMCHFNINQYDSCEIEDLLEKCQSLSNDQTEIIPKWNVIKQKGQRPYDGCKAVPFISEISGNGDWFPCGFMFGNKPQFDHLKFGNIQKTRLKDIFLSQRYLDILNMMKDFDVHNDCMGACRLDKCNEFLDTYLNPPKGINFI